MFYLNLQIELIQEKLLQIGRYQFFLLVTNKKKKAFMPRKPDSLNLTELVNSVEFFVHNKNMHGSMLNTQWSSMIFAF